MNSNSEISAFSADVAKHAKSSLALAFSKLYETGFPIVMGTVVVSLIFVQRKRQASPSPVA